jgi:hypothetical protein
LKNNSINKNREEKQMKNIITKKIGGMILAVLMVAAFAQVRVFAQQEDTKIEDQNAEQTTQNLSSEREDDNPLVGVWETVVTPRNCMTGVPVAPDFQGLLTFNEGGTFSEIASGGNPALRSPGHGIWQRTGGRRNYSMKFIFLRFNASGVLIGKQRVTQTIHLSANGDQSTTSGIVEVLDLNGNVLGGGCATSTATRFE